MKVAENPSLRALNTFGVEARAKLRIDIESEEDVLALPAFDSSRDLVLGGGSNVLLVSDVPGTVYLNRIAGRDVIEQAGGVAVVEVGAGENWHEFVEWCLQSGYSGIENLSLIPGSAGAAPMQNIGAYGVELSSLLVSVTAWEWRAQKWRVFSRDDCRFAYRDSRFKSEDPDRFLITSLRLALRLDFAPQLEYADLAEELERLQAGGLTARQVSDAVIRIRRRKLPDPARQGNAGSFFKNPIVSATEAEELLRRHPGLPAWPAGGDRTKLSAAWLIDRLGLKGHGEGGAAVSEQHALVLVNREGASGGQVRRLANRVSDAVEERFGVRLEVEPRIVDFT